MSEPSGSSSGGAYGEGVKWILTIATAAIAGAFLHLKEIEAERRTVQILMAVAVVVFVVCVWAGMHYLLWLNLVPLRKERIKDLRDELANVDDQLEAEAPRRKFLMDKITSDVHDLTNAEIAMPTWYDIFMNAFVGALALATVGVVTSMAAHGFAPQDQAHQKDNQGTNSSDRGGIKTVATSRDRFHIVYSAVHATGHGKEAHTFLINDETGALWQMICQNRNEVVFRKVPLIPEPKADK